MTIRGSYPGGPRRGADVVGEERAEGAPRVRRVEDLEERLGRASLDRMRQRRTRRIWSGFVIALVLSGGGGLYLGFRSHRSFEDITDARNAARQRPQFDPSFETNRVLNELWMMDIKQRQPSPP